MIKKILPVVLASAVGFYSGVMNHAKLDNFIQSKKYTQAPTLELVYSENEVDKTEITLINQKNAKRYPVKWGAEGLRVGSIEYRLACIKQEIKDKDFAIEHAKEILSSTREIRRDVYNAVIGKRPPSKAYVQDFTNIDIVYKLNENREVETFVTNGKEGFPLTRNMQMGDLEYRMKGLVKEATADGGAIYQNIRSDLLNWLDSYFFSQSNPAALYAGTTEENTGRTNNTANNTRHNARNYAQGGVKIEQNR
ncbi:MAG: hypothetical protein Q8O89_03280 [Nanoarchaeota archaeon]|nr:hypothetical protein [Nanoarchaeota archaeon]